MEPNRLGYNPSAHPPWNAVTGLMLFEERSAAFALVARPSLQIELAEKRLDRFRLAANERNGRGEVDLSAPIPFHDQIRVRSVPSDIETIDRFDGNSASFTEHASQRPLMRRDGDFAPPT